MSTKKATKKTVAKKPKAVIPDPKPKKKAAPKALAAPAWRESKATSFADPADVRAFRRCKQRGKSDNYCFSYGDNGIGVWGDNTAQETKPMVALPPEHMAEKFGDWRKAKHAKVVVEAPNGKTVNAIVADRMPWRKGRKYENMIDLNPAALKALGLKPPLMIDAKWKWA